MAPLTASQAVQQAGCGLRKGMDILSKSSSKPENVQRLALLSAAAAEDIRSITRNPTVKGQAAQWKGILKAAASSQVASTAAAYMTWFAQVILTPRQTSSSSGTVSTAPSKFNSTEQLAYKYRQEQACAGFESALEVLQAVLPDYTATIFKLAKATSTSQLSLVQAVLGSNLVGSHQQGFTGVLRQLLSRVAAPPATTSNQQDLHPRLRTRLIAATLRTYFSLSRAAVAVGSVEAAAQLLEEGLVLGMQRPDCHDLHALQPLLYELRAQLVYAENMKPYNPAAALLYWQLVARRKDLWWLALSAAGSALQLKARGLTAAGPGWATTRLAETLAPGIPLYRGATRGASARLLDISLALLLCACDGTMLMGVDLKGPKGTERPARGEGGGVSLTMDLLFHGGDGDMASVQPTLLQLQAVAEVLYGLQNTAVDMLCMASLLLGALVAVAGPGVRAEFLGSSHFQQVVGVLHQVAGSRMQLYISTTAAESLVAVAAAAEAAGPTASRAVRLPHTHTLVYNAVVTMGKQLEVRMVYNVLPQHLVLGLVQVLTMVPDTSREQGRRQEPTEGHQGLFHPSATCTPLESLLWAPGLPLSPTLWGLLERCVRAAEGTVRDAAMRLGKRWVQLAVEWLGKHSRTSSPTTTNSNSSDRAVVSWYGALGSLWISMAKSALVKGEYAQLQDFCGLAQQLLAALAHHPAVAAAEQKARAATDGHQPQHPQLLESERAAGSGIKDCLVLLGAVQRMVAVSTWAASWLDGVSRKPGVPQFRAIAAKAVYMHFRTALAGVKETMGQVCKQYKAAALAPAVSSGDGMSGASEATVRPPLYTAACGHAGCVNLSGPSEVTLVTNRGGVVCGGCGVVRFCCSDCAAKGRPAHRKECKRLGASNKAMDRVRQEIASTAP